MDFNYHSLELALECLQTEINFDKTSEYITKPQEIIDARLLVEAKRNVPQQLEAYPQVFQEKFGFINDLSVVDLIFNEGPNALNYLQRQEISLP